MLWGTDWIAVNLSALPCATHGVPRRDSVTAMGMLLLSVTPTAYGFPVVCNLFGPLLLRGGRGGGVHVKHRAVGKLTVD
jgi:hypothetical protein